ncbi:MAG: SDR family NAD(P)-dependent oxidoreductase [Ruminococcus sp.]|nr:SDR family NAD(P)-dependent oxidoreductase [Ruminococcus sp.]
MFDFSNLNNKVKDSAVIDNKVFVAAEKFIDLGAYDKLPKEYEYFQVPFIPRNASGAVDADKLMRMKPFSNKMMNDFKSESKNVPFRLMTTAKAGYFGINIPKYVPRINDTSSVSENNEPSLLDGGELTIRKPDDTLQNILIRVSKSNNKIVYFDTEEAVEETYADMYKAAVSKAGALRELGFKSGDKLMFLFNTNKQFIETYWACVILGITVLPLETVEDYSVECVGVNKIINIWKQFHKPGIVTDHDVTGLSKMAGESINIVDVTALSTENNIEEFHQWTDDEPALFFFTSGSTGFPKGVVLKQKNIFGRTLGEVQRYGMDGTEVDFNWMTLTHAAGLIWSHIRDVYLGIDQVQVKTEVILSKPVRFLEIMNKYRATMTWAPNFAFSLIVSGMDGTENYDWDLSCIKYMFAGGEANISKTLRHFLNILSKYGLKENVIRPAFGMAETSSCITYNDNFALSTSSDDDKNVSIGFPMPGIKVRVMSADGRLLPCGESGYIQCSGNTVTSGYYENDEANKNSFTDDGYLITGDLGYIKDGQIYLTGREKDVIIINGLNYFVQDIEGVVDNMDGVLTSYSVAVSIPDGNGKEKIIIFFVPEDESLLELKIADSRLTELVDQIKVNVRKMTTLSPDCVVPISSNYTARTDIGKKQRNTYKNDFLAGKFDANIEKVSKNRKQTILTKEWIRDNGTKYVNDIYLLGHSDSEFKSCDDIDSLPEGAVLIDNTFISETQADPDISDLKDIFEKTFSHLRKYCNTSKKINVIFTTLNSVPEMLGEKYSPAYSFLYGVLKTMELENSNFSFKLVDLDVNDTKLIKNEAALAFGREFIIYRQGNRYSYEYKPVEKADETETDLEGKLVVVAGGAGGIGKYIADYYRNEYSAKVLLIGRSDRQFENSDDILYLSADITDEAEVKKAVNKAVEKFGTKLGAVVDLAGRMSADPIENFYKESEKHTVENESTDNLLAAAAVKYYGTKNLYSVSHENNVPFIVFCSLTSDFGGRNMCAYSGANSMQDSYCRYIMQNDKNVKLISWSMWKETGLSRNSGTGASLGGFNELETEEAVELFNTIIKRDITAAYIGLAIENEKMMSGICNDYNITVIVETGNKEDTDILKELSSSEKFGKYDFEFRVNEVAFLKDGGVKDTIDKVLDIWKDTLKINDIDINANIFDIGGNSITIYLLADKMTKELGETINAVDIMTYPNVKEFASFLYLRSSGSSKEENNDDGSERAEKMKNARRRSKTGRRA